MDGTTVDYLDDVPGITVSSLFRFIRSTLNFDLEDENDGFLISTYPSYPGMELLFRKGSLAMIN